MSGRKDGSIAKGGNGIYQCSVFSGYFKFVGKNARESLEMVARTRPKVGDAPIILGGGSTGDNVYELLQQFDGVCVGAWIKDGDLLNPVNPDRARRYMEQVERARA